MPLCPHLPPWVSLAAPARTASGLLHLQLAVSTEACTSEGDVQEKRHTWEGAETDAMRAQDGHVSAAARQTAAAKRCVERMRKASVASVLLALDRLPLSSSSSSQHTGLVCVCVCVCARARVSCGRVTREVSKYPNA